MIILLHTSKTMLSAPQGAKTYRKPQLLEKAHELDLLLKKLSTSDLSKMMKISKDLAQKTYQTIERWNTDPAEQTFALDSFIGDIYSGLRAEEFSYKDRQYADRILFILSGLYGILKPLDGIFPYRLEMGYKLSEPAFKNLYEFWDRLIVSCIPKTGPIINLASEEFSKPITTFVDKTRIITPQFLTISPKTGKPTFVTVHSKITRGAFARWMILERISDVSKLQNFEDLGYKFDSKLSTAEVPTFVCQEFGGKGLSIKLKGKN